MEIFGLTFFITVREEVDGSQSSVLGEGVKSLRFWQLGDHCSSVSSSEDESLFVPPVTDGYPLWIRDSIPASDGMVEVVADKGLGAELDVDRELEAECSGTKSKAGRMVEAVAVTVAGSDVEGVVEKETEAITVPSSDGSVGHVGSPRWQRWRVQEPPSVAPMSKTEAGTLSPVCTSSEVFHYQAGRPGSDSREGAGYREGCKDVHSRIPHFQGDGVLRGKEELQGFHETSKSKGLVSEVPSRHTVLRPRVEELFYDELTSGAGESCFHLFLYGSHLQIWVLPSS